MLIEMDVVISRGFFSPPTPHPMFFLGLLLGCTACVREQVVITSPPVTKPDRVLEALTRSAKHIEKLWGQFAEHSTSSQTIGTTHRQQAAHPELQKRINLHWVGELRGLLRHLAKQVQYSFHELGRRPTLPVHISLRLENISVAEALQRAGLQAGQRAGVRVHSGAPRRIELVYTE